MPRGGKIRPNSNRQLAIAAVERGDTKFNGSPCVKCGGTLRYVQKNGGSLCVACQNRRSAEYRAANKDKCNSLVAKWHKDNAEYHRNYAIARRQRIKEQQVG